MKRLLLLLFPLAIGFASLTGPAAVAQSDTLAAVRAAERARFDALTATDTAAVRRTVHPELLYLHSNGLEESADDFVASVASGKIVYQSFTPLNPPRILLFGRTALVDGTVEVEGLYQGTEFAITLRYTSAYRLIDEQWLLIRWQSLKL